MSIPFRISTVPPPKPILIKTKKAFVGGLSSNTTSEDLRKYFETFGPVEDVTLMYDRATQRHRGFGFVTFETEETCEHVVNVHYHRINERRVECKRAQPKEVMWANSMANKNNATNVMMNGATATNDMFATAPMGGTDMSLSGMFDQSLHLGGPPPPPPPPPPPTAAAAQGAPFDPYQMMARPYGFNPFPIIPAAPIPTFAPQLMHTNPTIMNPMQQTMPAQYHHHHHSQTSTQSSSIDPTTAQPPPNYEFLAAFLQAQQQAVTAAQAQHQPIYSQTVPAANIYPQYECTRPSFLSFMNYMTLHNLYQQQQAAQMAVYSTPTINGVINGHYEQPATNAVYDPQEPETQSSASHMVADESNVVVGDDEAGGASTVVPNRHDCEGGITN
ncbi:hypothetical protein ACOME3_006725 [Neoechinorhynchus agilis]